MRIAGDVLNSTWGVSLFLCWACVACAGASQPSAEPVANPASSSSPLPSSPSAHQVRQMNGTPSSIGGLDVKGEPKPETAPAASRATTTPAVAAHEENRRSSEKPSLTHAAFTLPAVSPPFPATATPGDGHWQPFGEDSEQPRFWRTTLHPHARSRFVSVDVVAIDLRRFRLHWVVGAGDVGAESLADKQTPGLLARAWASDTVAIFNGGFQARHGYWGQQSHGVTLVKPKPDGCGMALYADGSVAFGSYADCERPDMVTYRQTPPCLVEKGNVHARLLAGKDELWAGKNAREKTRRRSAAGLNAERQILYYAVGVEATPLDLARAMEALGVHYALQLDINWNWTRFFLVDAVSDSPALGASLLEGMVADKGEYVRRASKRDFFAVVRCRSSD